MQLDDYLPLHAEHRCAVCGYWRGQHTSVGDLSEDREMLCPPVSVELADYLGVQPSFVPKPT
jgi:hypothetical protein